MTASATCLLLLPDQQIKIDIRALSLTGVYGWTTLLGENKGPLGLRVAVTDGNFGQLSTRCVSLTDTGISVEEQDQFPIQNIKNLNQAWKHQQTITNYCFLCVIPCVTLAIFGASKSSKSFIYADWERVKRIEPSFQATSGSESAARRSESSPTVT